MTPALRMHHRAIVPYFGSKRKLRRQIVTELGKHTAYLEPFCGSLAVLLAKPQSSQETVCDLHRQVTNLALVLQDEQLSVELYRRLSSCLFCETLLERSRRFLELNPPQDEPCVERAYHFMLFSWCGFNGTAGSARMSWRLAVRFTPGGGSPTTRFINAIESIPAWHHRLRGVTILNRDAFEVIPKMADDARVAIYCDPPYLLSTRTGDGDGGYLHDFEELPGMLAAGDDHARLAKLLNKFRNARIVVSYYDHPRLQELYPPDRWTHVPCYMQKNLRRSMQADVLEDEAPEVLIMNGPSFAQDGSQGCTRHQKLKTRKSLESCSPC